MWARIHADRSPWATSGHAGRLLKHVAPRPLWQELTGPSGHKLSLLEAGGRIHSDRSLGHLRTCSDASGGRGDVSMLMSCSLLRTRGESSGGNWAAFMLTGAPVSSGCAVRLLENVGPHPP